MVSLGEAGCEGCGRCFYKRSRFVGTRGNPKASIVFVGESPGSVELLRGVPFVGPPGQVLEGCFPDSLTDQEYYITNAMQCLPRKTKDANVNKARLAGACRNCNERLLNEIKAHPREVIVALGNTAIHALTGNFDLKITRERGKLFKSPLANRGILATVHPAYLLRGGGSYHKFRKDIEYALDLAAGFPKKKPIDPVYCVGETLVDVQDFIDYTFDQAERTNDWVLGADIETGGFDFRSDEILELLWCLDPREVFIVPDQLLQTNILAYRDFAKSRLNGGKFQWLWHNGKFDVKFLRHYGYADIAVDHDTLLQSYASEERRGFHDLEQIAQDELGAPSYKHMVDPYTQGKSGSYRNIPNNIRWEYGAKDASNTKQIHNKTYPRLLQDSQNTKLYHKVLLPASEMLVGVETRGVLVDFSRVKKNEEYFLEAMKEPVARMNSISQEFTGKDINPRSPKQVGHMIYNVLKLGKHAHSSGTGVTVLEELGTPHEFIRQLLKYRKLSKAYGTYVKNLKESVSTDGRVHTTFLLHGTTTGRLASRNPNMQNQPRGLRIRSQFIAKKDYIFCAIDLSQAELRSLAELSRDRALIRIYQTEGVSLHKEVSVQLWGEDWTDRYNLNEPGNPLYELACEEYIRTKKLNFGIIYGITARSIAKEFNASLSEAQDWLTRWADRFPDAWKYIQRCRMAPIKNQNLITPFGRRKRAGITSREKAHELQNEAANFPHQSIASDITLMSAVYKNDWLRTKGAYLVNTVHDEDLIEMPKDPKLFVEIATTFSDQIAETPRMWGLKTIPFRSDTKIGYSWGDMKEVDNTEEAFTTTLSQLEKPDYSQVELRV